MARLGNSQKFAFISGTPVVTSITSTHILQMQHAGGMLNLLLLQVEKMGLLTGSRLGSERTVDLDALEVLGLAPVTQNISAAP